MRVFVGLCLIVTGVGLGANGISRIGSDAEGAVSGPHSVAAAQSRPHQSERAAVPAPTRTPAVVQPPEPASIDVGQRAVATSPRVSVLADIPSDRPALMRELQRELIRVGCYTGSINGAWTPATRQAMRVFTDRVNAALPVNEPDVILLALLRSHPEKTCGNACPAGQALAADGQCLPHAIVARAAGVAATAAVARLASDLPPTKLVPAIAPRASAMAPAAAVPLEGRMSIGAPVAVRPDVSAAKRAAAAPRAKMRRAHDRYASPGRLRAYRPLRPFRFADRRPRGLAALLFGPWRF